MCLINATHEDFITQTGKKSKTAFKNFMGPGDRDWGPRKTNTSNFLAAVPYLLSSFVFYSRLLHT